jgi:fructoselysine-6-P-deglycase FrlB-like protein
MMLETPGKRKGNCSNYWVSPGWAGLASAPVDAQSCSKEPLFLLVRAQGDRVAYVDDEIASQPECWHRAAELARRVELALPRRGQRVAVVGCGTSWFIAQAYAMLREASGHGVTDAFPASAYPADRRYDRLLAITRSGTTTEVVRLLERARGGLPTTVLTGVPGAPVTELVAETIALGFADERSVVQTRFATSALTLLRAHLGTPPPLDAGRAALQAELPLDPAATEQVTFLGSGWVYGLAQEAALKCREAAGLWVEAYPAMEYRHGPIAIAQPGRAVWALDALPDGLAEQIAATGATLVQAAHDPLAELVLAQRYAIAAAAHRGLDPDSPRALTRSIVLS